MAPAPSRSSFSMVVLPVFTTSAISTAAVAFHVAFDGAASVTSVAFVTSPFFDLSSVALVLSNPTLYPKRATRVR